MYTHENRAELLADVKCASDTVDILTKLCADLDSKIFEAKVNHRVAYEFLAKLRLVKDEFGIYMCDDNYEVTRQNTITAKSTVTIKKLRELLTRLTRVYGYPVLSHLRSTISSVGKVKLEDLTPEELNILHDSLLIMF